jgi:sugar lactone lactonase YvrE
MSRILRLNLASLLIALLALSAFQTAQAQTTDSQTFPETGFTVSGKFLEYWRANGGLPVFGYPITSAVPEVDPETGKTYLTQWFERNRFELHPENAGTKYEVLLGLLGKDLRREALAVDPDFVRNPPLSATKNLYFEETGHNVDAGIYSYWQANGGLERFGYPIAEPGQEVDPETGKVFLMQWFERARIEYHPENKAPYNYLLGLLGNQIKKPNAKVEHSWRINAPRFAFGLATDRRDNVYVTDLPNAQIVKYNNAGQKVGAFGSRGAGNGQFQNLAEVATDASGNIYAGEDAGPDGSGTPRVQKFDANGNFQLSLGAGQLRSVGGIAIDRSANIFVSDPDGGRVYKFGSNGSLQKSWDTADDKGTRLKKPSGLAIDSAGNLYVADYELDIVIQYSGNGDYQDELTVTNNGAKLDLGGNIAVDWADDIYFHDAGNTRLLKFSLSNGTRDWAFGSKGEGSGQFNSISSFAVDTSGNIFVSNIVGERGGYLAKMRQR